MQTPTHWKVAVWPLLCFAAACAPAPVSSTASARLDFGGVETDADGRCFGRDVAPAVIETITEQIEERAAVRDASGAVIAPAVFRTVTRQNIVRERAGLRFETLCPPQYTTELVASLQRALTVRGTYGGPINGVLDRATGQAVQRFQRIDGHDSPLLDIRTARALGLVVLSADELSRG